MLLSLYGVGAPIIPEREAFAYSLLSVQTDTYRCIYATDRFAFSLLSVQTDTERGELVNGKCLGSGRCTVFVHVE